MPKRSNYQDRIIRNYYQNRDTIMLQRLGELVTDLFLAEGKAKARAVEAGGRDPGETQGPEKPGPTSRPQR